MSIATDLDPARLRRVVERLFLDAGQVVAARTEALRRRAAPVTDVVTPSAWTALSLVVLAVVGTLVLHWAELWVAAWVLGLVLLGAVAFVLGSHQLKASLDLSRDRVVVGEKASGRLLVTNSAVRRTLPLTIELPVGAGRADFDLPSLPGHAEHEDLFAIPTNRRAVLVVGPVSSVRADPLTFLKRQQDLTEAQLLHVHPRTVPIEGSASGIINDLEGQTTRKLSNSDVSFHALRAYVPGDDRRYVHWKTTARTGTLMVRQFEETKRSHLLVALSTRLDEYADQEEFEVAISVAASLGLQSMRDKQTLSVATSTRTLPSPHPHRLLDQLSALDYESGAPRLGEVTRRLANEVGDASVAVVVCGSVVHAAEIRRAARTFALDVRAIVVRSEPTQESSLRRLGDVDVASLQHLDDLPTMIRRLTR